MEKFKKELVVMISLDNEFHCLIEMILEELNKNSTDHFVRYDRFSNVEMTMYIPIESKVSRNKNKVTIEYVSRVTGEPVIIPIDNKTLLEMKIEECFKLD